MTCQAVFLSRNKKSSSRLHHPPPTSPHLGWKTCPIMTDLTKLFKRHEHPITFADLKLFKDLIDGKIKYFGEAEVWAEQGRRKRTKQIEGRITVRRARADERDKSCLSLHSSDYLFRTRTCTAYTLAAILPSQPLISLHCRLNTQYHSQK